MYATNVRNLKRNPSEALRHAELEPVLILKGNHPNALILNINSSLGDVAEQLKPALAASLFKDRVLSLGAAAQVSGLETGGHGNWGSDLTFDKGTGLQRAIGCAEVRSAFFTLLD
ncbi:MAG: hypothetical protein HOP34_02835 [Methylococcaceae bacterium]|nr:hypothetical protein [Methylococcaceae bacterium]